MKSEALYEQYKDALKRGHVASLRGRIADALTAYAEAARIAPERATPHAAAGTALLRRGQAGEALRQFEVAVSIAPRDEASLLGRAQALAALGQRGDAADAYDALADLLASDDRLADAVDAARRGLEMAEGRDRRRTLERLISRLRSTGPGDPGRRALEQALRTLDGPAVPPAAGAAQSAPAPAGRAAESEVAPAAESDLAAASSAEAPGPAAAATAEALEPVPAPSDAVPIPRAPARRAIPDGATAAELDARAEAAADAGLPGPAVDALLDLAALHARDGRIDAALDACYAALAFDPDSTPLHLALVELYVGRGWDAMAREKLDLLERLARLDADEAVLADIAGVRAARL